MNYILSLDQGTTSSRAILYDETGNSINQAQEEFRQIFPKSGWVEQDPKDILASQLKVADELLGNLGPEDKVMALGISNQRETTIIWDRKTGQPIHNAIVWQDRRTTKYCKQLIDQGVELMVTGKTGLLLDPYFSATKIKWLLDNVPGARDRANNGDILFGTVDSWLVWNLTDGQVHATDVTNASRTLLYNIHTLSWDNELLDLFEIPASILPKVLNTTDDYGAASIKGRSIPISAVAGDQQAALFGQMCIEKNMVKCTYGTGCFMVLNTGSTPVNSGHKLLTTIGWKINEDVTYALEGSVFVGGAIVQWLRDEMKLLNSAEDSESLANQVEDTDGVIFVPALAGLGAPFWDPSAKGTIFGITRGTTPAHITRAALESIALRVNDILEIMSQDSGKPIKELRVDGGATANNLLMQMQADFSDIDVLRPAESESTAIGAAYLAGISVGLWNLDRLKNMHSADKRFKPVIQDNVRKEKLKYWKKAIQRCLDWAE